MVTSDNAGADLVALMVAYQAGSLEAFEALYRALERDLGRYFAARVGSGAPDLVQDTFLEMHRSRHTYLPPLPVAPWVFGVARNVERRHWRRRRRHESRLAALPAEPPACTEREAYGLSVFDVAGTVQRLPAAGRSAWVLRHVHGLSFAEIAGRLRIETGTARVRVHRAMATLRAMLGIEPGRGHD